jgi:hypothetical protein
MRSRIALPLRLAEAPDRKFTDCATGLCGLRRRVSCDGMTRIADSRASVAFGVDRAASIGSSTGL